VVIQHKPVSGANAIPLGSNQDPRHHAPRRSVFQRISWPQYHQAHFRFNQRDNLGKFWHRKMQPKNMDHQSNWRRGNFRNSNLGPHHYYPGNPRGFSGQVNSAIPLPKIVQRGARGETISNSNFKDKGKAPMQSKDNPELWPCVQCAASGLQFTICKHWSICSGCKKKGSLSSTLQGPMAQNWKEGSI
jgi:hypothetical protein